MSTDLKQASHQQVATHMNVRRDTEQLHRDRWTAGFVVAIMAALLALLVWAASNGGIQYDGPDHWYMMP